MNLRRDIQEHWRAGLLVPLVYLLAVLMGSCTGSLREPTLPPEHPTHWSMGGPGWRVTDVAETTDLAGLNAIYTVAEEVAECLGVRIDLRGWRFFGTNSIRYRVASPNGTWQWRWAHGVALLDERWVYVQAEGRRRGPDRVMGTLKHELVHVALPELGHPAVDRLIGKCAGQHVGQERYLGVYLRQ